jgi:F420H(2)-dependent quinone reductase
MMKRCMKGQTVSQFTKMFIQLNISLYRLTNGVLGGQFGSSRVLLLTTTGRKTGKPRTVPLRCLREGEAYLIAASNWGKEQPPAWYYNLQAQPVVNIQVMGQHMVARAEAATPEQYDRLYQRFIEADKRFDGYRETAHRTIPVILLHPQA